MKTCTRCGKPKPLKAFHVNRSKPDGRGHACKECQRKYNREHYRKNRKQYMARAKEVKNRLRALSDELKSVPCADCGGSFPACCMDFHHETGEKEMGVSLLVARGNTKRFREEVAKCVVLCANCHRIRHHCAAVA